jgi:LysM repeat protein
MKQYIKNFGKFVLNEQSIRKKPGTTASQPPVAVSVSDEADFKERFNNWTEKVDTTAKEWLKNNINSETATNFFKNMGLSKENAEIAVNSLKTLKQVYLEDIHIVSDGDTLWDISMANRVPVEEIKRINGLDSDMIYPGMKLKLKE